MGLLFYILLLLYHEIKTTMLIWKSKIFFIIFKVVYILTICKSTDIGFYVNVTYRRPSEFNIEYNFSKSTPVCKQKLIIAVYYYKFVW